MCKNVLSEVDMSMLYELPEFGTACSDLSMLNTKKIMEVDASMVAETIVYRYVALILVIATVFFLIAICAFQAINLARQNKEKKLRQNM